MHVSGTIPVTQLGYTVYSRPIAVHLRSADRAGVSGRGPPFDALVRVKRALDELEKSGQDPRGLGGRRPRPFNRVRASR